MFKKHINYSVPAQDADSGDIKYAGNTLDTYHGQLDKHETQNVPKDTTVLENAQNALVGFWGFMTQ